MDITEKNIEDAFNFYLKKHKIVVKDSKELKSQYNIWYSIQLMKLLRDKKDYALEL
jgi:hypothetical protein